jgi:hypothetical protein
MEKGYFAISNAELDACEYVEAGSTIRCQRCGEIHELTGADPPNRAGLLFYSCRQQTCLAAVDNRLIVSAEVVKENGGE